MRISDWSSDVCSSDLVQAYAGIDVVRWTAGHSDVSIRGGVQAFNPRLLVLVNGRQVYLDHYGMTNWAGLGVQLEEIQQIEIVRGPNSALFGFNAVSGVINIITINPLQSRQLTMTAEVGAEGQRSEEHTSELQSLMRISYAVFCLKKKKKTKTNDKQTEIQTKTKDNYQKTKPEREYTTKTIIRNYEHQAQSKTKKNNSNTRTTYKTQSKVKTQ